MSEMMSFPDTWEEYEKLYGFNDSEEIYTNNSRLIPSFRVKQWLDHETKRQAIKASDRIYRQQALDAIRNIKAITGAFDDEILLIDKAQAQTELMMLPSVEPDKNAPKTFKEQMNLECAFCRCHERGDTLYESSDWDGGISFDYIRDIKYCPICGRGLLDDDD